MRFKIFAQTIYRKIARGYQSYLVKGTKCSDSQKYLNTYHEKLLIKYLCYMMKHVYSKRKKCADFGLKNEKAELEIHNKVHCIK